MARVEYEIIAPFVDRRSRETVFPGSPIPTTLSESDIKSLVRSRCIRQAVQSGMLRSKAEATGVFPGAEHVVPSGAGSDVLAGQDGSVGGKRSKPRAGGRGKP